jgi:hypothetical protein
MLRLSVAGLSMRRPGLYSTAVHAEILVEKVALGQGQHCPTKLYNHVFIHHRCSITSVIRNIVKNILRTKYALKSLGFYKTQEISSPAERRSSSQK